MDTWIESTVAKALGVSTIQRMPPHSTSQRGTQEWMDQAVSDAGRGSTIPWRVVSTASLESIRQLVTAETALNALITASPVAVGAS